ncbi:(Na+)-NQR maturation NqrM [Vibrio sp. TRT 2004]|uniref:(Na+)-NQR maturation NqrM n=1 Tax=Vibrio sp. TRT 2004 TaxID=3418506 RepID=UPI003CEC54D9
MTYLISFAVFITVVGMMAMGVVLKRHPIQGSCGGLATIEIERECNCVEICAQHSRKLYQIEEPNSVGATVH